MNKIKKRIILISEGKRLQDRLKIVLSILSMNYYKPEVFLKNKEGLFFVRKKSSDLWMLSTIGEQELRKYFILDKGSFLDIGANVGKYTVIVGKELEKSGKVFSFEPEPSNLAALKRNVELNGLNNIVILPLACSDEQGSLSFYLDKTNTGGHSLVKKTKNKIIVNAERLDIIIKEKKIKDVRLIKIDVEGAEMRVLQGAKELLKKQHPKIIFETDHPSKVIFFLEKFKYKIKKISKRDYLAY